MKRPRHRPRTRHIAAAFAVLGMAASVAAAVPQPPRDAPRRVSLELRNVELGAALVQLADRAGGAARFEVTPEVRRLRVTAVVSEQPVETALRTLLRAASPALAFTVETVGGRPVYRISARAAERKGGETSAGAAFLTLDVAGASLDDVLRAVSLAAGDVRAEGADVAAVSVTVAFARLPLDRALDAVAAGASPQLRWSREGGAVVFRPLEGAFTAGGAAPNP